MHSERHQLADTVGRDSIWRCNILSAILVQINVPSDRIGIFQILLSAMITVCPGKENRMITSAAVQIMPARIGTQFGNGIEPFGKLTAAEEISGFTFLPVFIYIAAAIYKITSFLPFKDKIVCI